jgi:hypothetical protein
MTDFEIRDRQLDLSTLSCYNMLVTMYAFHRGSLLRSYFLSKFRIPLNTTQRI